MKLLKKSLAICIATLLVVMGLSLGMAVKASAITNFTLEIGFADDYVSEQGHVEYQINDDAWVSVSVATGPLTIDQEVTSLKFRVVPNEFYEVNFDNGPTLEDAIGFYFGAGGTDTERAALISEAGYACTLVRTDESGDHDATKVSLKGVAFRETEAQRTADVSFDITGPGLEFWEEDIPSRINFRLPGTEDIAMGKGNLEWNDGKRPPNATGVKTVNPVQVTYDYDNSGNVTLTYTISNASTKITSLKINGTDYTSSCPSTDAEILGNIADGGRSTKPISITVPHAAAYNIEVVASEHDLMGGFGWNYLPEEDQSGDSREDCIAHGTLEFVKGEYNGTVYNSVSKWNNASAYGAHVFNWTDGDKNYSDERDAWGSAAFPKGAKITLKLIPDEGYQLVSLYGDQNLVREEEVGTYTITMAGGMNSHLMATFVSVEDYVKVSASAVTSGNVSNLENTFGEGTMKLNVDNADVSGESISAFEAKAAEEEAEIKEYIDINLANTIYKATDNPDDAWDRAVTELSNPASITLELSNDYSGENIIIIHEHDGQYETIPVTYDSENNSISFEVAAFSNYAIATVNPEETDPSDEPTEDPSDEPTEDPSDEPRETEEEYSISTTDKKFIVEFTDKKDIPFSLMVIEFLKLSDDELAAMEIPKEMFQEMKSQIETLTKPSGKLLGLYEIILIDDNSGGTGGRGPYTLRIKISDELKNYTDFKITELNGFGDEGFTPFAPISLKEVDGYLVAKVDRVGTYAFNGIVRDEQSRTPDSNSDKKPHNGIPATGDNTNILFWILLLGIASSGIALTKRS